MEKDPTDVKHIFRHRISNSRTTSAVTESRLSAGSKMTTAVLHAVLWPALGG